MKPIQRHFLITLLLGLGLLGGTTAQAATEIFNEAFRDGTEPTDWSSVDVTYTTAAGGRADISGNTGILTSPIFDASALDNLSIDFQVAKLGSGPDGPVTVEYSLNSGADWIVLGDSPTPSSSTYLPAEFILGATSATMQLRFTAANSTSAKRFRDLVVTGFEGGIPPELGALTLSAITAETATASIPFMPNSGTGFIDHGFLVALSSVNPEPEFGDMDAALIDFAGQPPATLEVILTDLDPVTEYAVRAFVRYDDGTLYSEPGTLLTRPTDPLLQDGVPYTQDFSDFVDMLSLPAGWSFDLQGSTGDYAGDWGDGFFSGFRGNADVLGYQVTGGSNSLIKILTLVNDTGAEINELTITYTGRAERLDQIIDAEYTITVEGVAVPGLTYATDAGDSQLRQAVVSGLSIADGESFSIEWLTQRLAGDGSAKQIGISDVSVAVGASLLQPTIGFFGVFDGSLTESGFGVDAETTSDGGSSITAMGFILTETAVEANPDLDTPGATIVFDDFPGVDFFFTDFEGLSPSTSYSVRAFATNAVGTTYTSVLEVTTLGPPPALVDGIAYAESFSNFTGTLPNGWSVAGAITNYQGDWGTGFGAGLRGGEETPGVLGYQHTGSTGTFTITLELINETGSTISDLLVAYTGRVERATEGRSPAWTVSVDGVEVPELSYSTADGIDKEVEALVSGLSIAPGASFTITWSSDRDFDGGGSSRQIGLSNVSVESVEVAVATPLLSVGAGTYFEDQTVFVTNFGAYAAEVELYYTLDGTDPDETSTLYNDALGIFVEDGFGPAELRIIGIDSLTSETSVIASALYNFPQNVADLAALRDVPTGSALYRVESAAILTAQTAFRNTKFLQDGSGVGIQIDDNSGIITTAYVTGDAIENLVGSLTVFQGQLQLLPAIDPGAPVSSGNAVMPAVRTLDSLTSADQATLVVITDAEFEDADGVATFGGGGAQTAIGDSSVIGFTGVYRNIFGDSDITGALLPTGTGSITGIIVENNSGLTIGARSLADLGFAPPAQGPLESYLTERNLTEADLEVDTNGNGFTVIEEYFAGFGDGIGSDTILYGIDPAAAALTLTSDLQSDPDGVIVELLATSDLAAGFLPVSFTVSSVDNGDGTFTRSYIETQPPAQATSRFYQLRLTAEAQ
ncbi:MAG: hypothetical protein EA353_07625 [Puniceicoccaceae bacterium]|nr:MAG: hypothetical protein EA353_07625 [Puniceicoccaceae bacterium]